MEKKNKKNSYIDKNGKFNFGKCINTKAINALSEKELKVLYNIVKNVK